MQERHKNLFLSPTKDQNAINQFEKDLTALLDENPDHPVFLFQLGTFYMQLDKCALAAALIRRGMETGCHGAAPWLNLAGAYKINHHDDKVLECYKKALAEAEKEGDPEIISHALHGIGSIYINKGEPDTCLHWSNKALEKNPTDRFAQWNKGIAHLERGDWAEGFDLYHQAGFAKGSVKAPERKIKEYGGLPQWDGKPLPDGSKPLVICYGEQGVGDEVMFASMIPDLMKDCRVVFDIDNRLMGLFKRSFPEAEGIYNTSGIDDPFPWIVDHPDAVATVPMGSLGHFYRRKAADFPKVPYLTADPDLRAKWREVLKPYTGLKIGISYAGGLKKTRADQRTILFERFSDILELEDTNFFSLQYHPWAADEASKIGGQIGKPVHHWGDVVAQQGDMETDWDNHAAFISELDLIITTNTSLHHMAGALGVNQWCLCPKFIAWRYGISGDSPWYANCRMIRQKKADDWKPVLKTVERDLHKMVEDKMNSENPADWVAA
jgi:tetratricopeptide (TPR) repeat protein